jgi:uncharacterized FlaG/YvyC family protein
LEAAMSSDFSVKPVGAPVATAMAQPASPAADEAVATELPAHQSVAAADASPRVRHDTQSASDGVSHQVIIDRDAGSIVYQVVDNRTSLVVKQFPDQAILRRRAYFRALDLMKDDARIRFTDRSA